MDGIKQPEQDQRVRGSTNPASAHFPAPFPELPQTAHNPRQDHWRKGLGQDNRMDGIRGWTRLASAHFLAPFPELPQTAQNPVDPVILSKNLSCNPVRSLAYFPSHCSNASSTVPPR